MRAQESGMKTTVMEFPSKADSSMAVVDVGRVKSGSPYSGIIILISGINVSK